MAHQRDRIALEQAVVISLTMVLVTSRSVTVAVGWRRATR
jgi:hypothetical protein